VAYHGHTEDQPISPAELLPHVYAELRKLAAAKLAREDGGHTFDATALVHEVWLKLADAEVDWQDKTHFYRTAATAMRRFLIDHARAKGTAKRGGGAVPISLSNIAMPLPNTDWESLDEMLTKLAETKPDHVKLIELRFFAGLTNDEAATVLGVSPATAERMLRYARAWLAVECEK
jgi:RNA polymerase sigma factor (TIGR02999 family)